MRIALAQTDCRLGDVDANAADAARTVEKAAAEGADLVVFPELALHGYALGHIGEDRSIPATDPRITRLTEAGPDVVIGFHEDGGARTHNSAVHLSREHGRVHLHRKLYLPNYLQWEERKNSSPGQSLNAYDTAHGRMATLVCNDAWQPVLPWLAVQDGATVLIVPTNSATTATPEPQSMDTAEYWRELIRYTARMQQTWVVFVNRVGEEAGARFWGGSQVVDPHGRVVAQAPLWEESLTVVDIDVPAATRARRRVPLVAEGRLGLVNRVVDRLIREGGDA